MVVITAGNKAKLKNTEVLNRLSQFVWCVLMLVTNRYEFRQKRARDTETPIACIENNLAPNNLSARDVIALAVIFMRVKWREIALARRLYTRFQSRRT